ncbi:MAG: right-handed parallel beta-helix repeat-containing protein [Planctomycetes bacterium]|nr:right-handed parallel beta-helix repeat-containing protein [Planctomycetota bacterium]
MSPRPSLALVLGIATSVTAQSWLPSSPFPSWATGSPGNVTSITWDPGKTATENGIVLENAAENLQPGQSLSVGPGVWSVPNRFDLSMQGTAAQPVWIFASDPNDRPVITRPDNGQNCINIGSNGPCRYLVLQNLEFTGGGDLVRIYDGSELWLDGCYIHDGDGVGIAVQTHDCRGLFITRNEIARPGPGTPGEGMYLGANYSTLRVTDSVIAFNHVHDLKSAQSGQGDGIEVKQGSTRNWVLGNHVHDCKNPCILVYGTDGIDENVVDGNLCYDSDDAVLQVQGEAIVRNNVAIGGLGAFESHDHQGTSQNLQLIHNTFVSAGRAATLARWGGRSGMVLANNVIYSTGSNSLYFGIGDAGVTATGNVLFGPSNHTGGGYRFGTGLLDFENVSLQPLAIDARPRVGGPIDNRGDPAWQLPIDRNGTARSYPPDPGAFANADTFTADTATLPTSGGVQHLALDLGANYGTASYVIGMSTAGVSMPVPIAGFYLPVQLDELFVLSATGGLAGLLQNGTGALAVDGRASAALFVPPIGPAAAGLTISMAAIVAPLGTVAHVSNPIALTLQ